jgi:hypothetical protein
MEHLSLLGIKYKNLKGEPFKITNAKKQQIMIKDLKLMTYMNLDFASYKESST